MGKRKRKLTAAERAAKQRRKAEFRTVFINGKQKRVRRPPTIDGMSVEEFIRRNADPIFLHEHEMWELLEEADEATEDSHVVVGFRGRHAARHPELTMIVEPDGEMFMARCPELNIACRGYTEEDARANLAEDVEIFFECADEDEPEEVLSRTPVVHAHPEIVSGEPVFAGTRVPARNLVEWLTGGHTLDGFLDNFPSVTREQAVAFLHQATEALLAKLPSPE